MGPGYMRRRDVQELAETLSPANVMVTLGRHERGASDALDQYEERAATYIDSLQEKYAPADDAVPTEADVDEWMIEEYRDRLQQDVVAAAGALLEQEEVTELRSAVAGGKRLDRKTLRSSRRHDRRSRDLVDQVSTQAAVVDDYLDYLEERVDTVADVADDLHAYVTGEKTFEPGFDAETETELADQLIDAGWNDDQVPDEYRVA